MVMATLIAPTKPITIPYWNSLGDSTNEISKFIFEKTFFLNKYKNYSSYIMHIEHNRNNFQLPNSRVYVESNSDRC